MLVRIKFIKYGPVKFIGHLDIMRYFQKAVSRSGLKISYSQGFHPHQLMTFASPLGVGLTSEAEYLDFELLEELLAEEVCERLNRVLYGGIQVTQVSILTPREPNRKKISAMALVNSADYLIYRRKNTEPSEYRLFQEAVNRFFGQASIMIVKETKTGSGELDLRKYLFCYGIQREEFLRKHTIVIPQDVCEYHCTESLPKTIQTEQIITCYTEQTYAPLYLHLAAGSAMNIRPELVLSALLDVSDSLSWKAGEFQIHRMELYSDSEEGSTPLWAIK